MSLTVAALRALLAARMPSATRTLIVALSGGTDSAVLLAALAASDGPALPWAVRAVHVDHGLQAAAGMLKETCITQCRALGVPLTVKSVDVDLKPGESVEAKAREVRYAALGAEVHPEECLITAHHAEDQAETLLLQGLRGAGLKGLSAMPWLKPLGAGWHLRPLLDVRQEELLALGARLRARGADDPMNQDARFDRSYLRQEVWPLLKERWPGAGAALARSARHAADAQAFIETFASHELTKLRDGAALLIPGLRSLDAARRANAVRLWLAEAGVEPPSEARILEALRQMFDAKADHLPAVLWGEHALRRYRHRLFLTAAQPPKISGAHRLELKVGSRVALGEGLGALCVERISGGLDAARIGALTVRPRVGGETLKPARSARTRSVQNLCQEWGVLPWMREALPYMYVEHVEQPLVAVGDFWLDVRWCVAAAAPGVGFRWEQAPEIV